MQALKRFLADSNCCRRFCRPVPNHSAKEPCFVKALQRYEKNFNMQIFCAYFFVSFVRIALCRGGKSCL